MALLLSYKNIVHRASGRIPPEWRYFSSQIGTASPLVERPATFVEDDNDQQTGNPEKRFNKSRLLPQHRNMLQEHAPYLEPHSWIHLSEKYNRKMFGRYGIKSGVNPRICAHSRKDLDTQAEYVRKLEPYTISEMVAKVREEEAVKLDTIKKREEEIAKKLAKLQQWNEELNAKIAKKEADVLAAKERKERLIEEVRRHFGFKVDPRDERFKEMLEQKEREDKRKQKEAKKKIKEEKMMAKLVEKTSKI